MPYAPLVERQRLRHREDGVALVVADLDPPLAVIALVTIWPQEDPRVLNRPFVRRRLVRQINTFPV